jgi:toxin secretion/phage lysis holin
MEATKVIDTINIGYGFAISLLTMIFGEHWVLFAGFLVLECLDWITGNYKARILHKESSMIGAKGAAKKVFQLAVIGIAFFISFSFVEMGEIIGVDLHFVQMFGWLTLAMYMVNELRSILENLVEIGVEVPEILIKGLDITKKLMEAEGGEIDEAREDHG